MRYLVTKKQLDVILEQLNNQGPQIKQRYGVDPAVGPSDYLGKGGELEKKLYDNKSQEEYFKLMKLKLPTTRRVRMIFPEKKWEMDALELLKNFGVVTGVYKTFESAKNFINELVRENVVVNELVIGSHGSGGDLLRPMLGQKNYKFNNTFLDEFKKIVNPNTIVFFTACKGADFLDSLKEAAERLGTTTYGSAGIYDYITNTSEKGFYRCSPKKFNLPVAETIPGFKLNRDTVEVNIMSSQPWYEIRDSEFDTKITIKKGVLNDKEIVLKAKTKQVNDYKVQGMNVRMANVFRLQNWIDLSIEIMEQLPELDRKKRDELWKKGEKLISDYISDKIKSNEIIVEINTGNGFKNAKNFPNINIPDEVNNEFLLANKFCTKVNSSPISWV